MNDFVKVTDIHWKYKKHFGIMIRENVKTYDVLVFGGIVKTYKTLKAAANCIRKYYNEEWGIK